MPLLRENQWMAVVDHGVGMMFLTYAMVLVLTTLLNAPRVALVMTCASVCMFHARRDLAHDILLLQLRDFAHTQVRRVPLPAD